MKYGSIELLVLGGDFMTGKFGVDGDFMTAMVMAPEPPFSLLLRADRPPAVFFGAWR